MIDFNPGVELLSWVFTLITRPKNISVNLAFSKTINHGLSPFAAIVTTFQDGTGLRKNFTYIFTKGLNFVTSIHG